MANYRVDLPQIAPLLSWKAGHRLLFQRLRVRLWGESISSYVAFTKEGQLLVRRASPQTGITNPEGTILKQREKWALIPLYHKWKRVFTGTNFSFYLQKIKKDAETFLGQP